MGRGRLVPTLPWEAMWGPIAEWMGVTDARDMDIVLIIGEEDPFKANNQHLSHILAAKGIEHRLEYWQDRAHRSCYWRQMAPHFV